MPDENENGPPPADPPGTSPKPDSTDYRPENPRNQGHPCDTKTAVATFVECLFEPDDIVEVRRLPSKRSTWHKAEELVSAVDGLLAKNEGGQNISVGVNPRKRKGGRKSSDVACVRAILADFDGGIDFDGARNRWESAGMPPPTLTLSSGHGIHAYWRLSEPLTDCTQWTLLQKKLAKRLESDPNVSDPPRVMRLPGFLNHKPPSARSTVLDADCSRRYTLAELDLAGRKPPDESALGTSDATTPKTQGAGELLRATAYVRSIPGVDEGGRNDAAYEVATILTHDFGLPIEQAYGPLAAWNTQNTPPLPPKELRDCLKKGKKYGRKPVGYKLALPEPCHTTDAGHAQRFATQHGKKVRFAPNLGWLVWDGTHWRQDSDGELERLAKKTARSLYYEADDPRAAKYAESKTGIHNMLALAQSEPGICVAADRWDADPMLLNVLNGTIDLRTGKLREHRRDDLITQVCEVKYDPDAKAPRWERFIAEIMAEDEELSEYLQRALGYGLTGATREQCMFFLYGSGANGKSTMLRIMQGLLGEYARQTDPETLMVKPGGQIRNDLARLAGARFVVANETTRGRKLDEALVKQLTGDDKITARFLYKEHFEFVPEFKVFLAGNHKPNLQTVDPAIRRRIHLIPFTETFKGDRRDRGLLDKLRCELPGILAWLIRGCLDWQREGLNPPRTVRQATEDYLDEQDALGEFLNECCVRGDGYSAKFSDLYTAFERWCRQRDQMTWTKRGFAGALENRGFHSDPRRDGKYRRGLSLKVESNSQGQAA